MAIANLRIQPRFPTWTVYLAGLLPALWYAYQIFYGDLGADPAKTLEHAMGEWALRFLILGLAITPLRRELGIGLLKYRRAVGLIAFLYVVLHLTVYLLLDQGLDWSAIWADILKRPYITIGMAGFVLLLPLAATSFNAAIRWLGGRNWNRLHKLVYPAVLAGSVHYVMLVKSWPVEPLVYLAIVVALLGWRVWRRT